MSSITICGALAGATLGCDSHAGGATVTAPSTSTTAMAAPPTASAPTPETNTAATTTAEANAAPSSRATSSAAASDDEPITLCQQAGDYTLIQEPISGYLVQSTADTVHRPFVVPMQPCPDAFGDSCRVMRGKQAQISTVLGKVRLLVELPACADGIPYAVIDENGRGLLGWVFHPDAAIQSVDDELLPELNMRALNMEGDTYTLMHGWSILFSGHVVSGQSLLRGKLSRADLQVDARGERWSRFEHYAYSATGMTPREKAKAVTRLHNTTLWLLDNGVFVGDAEQQNKRNDKEEDQDKNNGLTRLQEMPAEGSLTVPVTNGYHTIWEACDATHCSLVLVTSRDLRKEQSEPKPLTAAATSRAA